MNKRVFIAFLAVLLLSVSLFAGGNQETNAEEGPTVLKWYMVGSGIQPDHEMVMDKVNAVLEEKLNVVLDWVIFDWGSYDDKMRMKIAAGEEFDLCFTSLGWVVKYQENVARGAFLPLTDLLPEYAPTYYNTVPQKFWEAAKINGEIYGAMNYQTLVEQRCMLIRKDLVDKYDLDYQNAETVDDFEEFMKIFVENEPNLYPIGVERTPELPMEFLAGVNLDINLYTAFVTPLRISFSTEDFKFQDPTRVSDIRRMSFEKMHEWYQAGYIRKDAASIESIDADVKAGRVAMWPTVYKPGVAAEQSAKYGYELVAVPLTLPTIRTRSVLSGMSAVSRTSKHPEKAVQVLEELFTNKELYNLMAFGIEGVHYTDLEGPYIEKNADTGYWSGIGWQLVNQFNSHLLPGQPENVWDLTMQINEEAYKSPIAGFTFDASSVKNEQAAFNVVNDEIEAGLYTGMLNPDEYIPIYEKRLQEADPDNAIWKAAQEQLDAWVRANGIR